MNNIPYYRFLGSLLLPLRSGAFMRSRLRQHKPPKVKIAQYIQLSTYVYDQRITQ
jgi:hypothetical protein